MTPYPFLIVVDDGGFDQAGLECGHSPIELDHYVRIAALGRSYGVRIPVCFTVKFLDWKLRSEHAKPLPYVDDLVSLLHENADAIEVGYHGLVHEHQDGAEEFYDLRRNRPVPEQVQRRHLEWSRDILSDCGLRFPELFVPPYHAWEEGVTDRLAADFGVRFLIGYPSMKYTGHRYTWAGSGALTFLPRTSLGVNGCDVDIRTEHRRSLRMVPGEMSIVDFMRRHVVPQALPWRIRIGRSLRIRPVHSYMTHIGNFSAEAMDCWRRLFDDVLQRSDLELCKSSADASLLYRTLTDDRRDARHL